MARVRQDGKQFACGEERFLFRGVTYGTFRPRADGAQVPERPQVRADFAAMRAAGFTVVRTYTAPPDDVVDEAGRAGLRLLSDMFYPDWRYLLGASRGEQRRVAREGRACVRAAARRLRGNEHVLAVSLGNEIPADVLRWVGTARIARILEELAEVVRDEDPEMLVTYANYPTAEYLPLDRLDFLTVNVFLERRADFRRYLTRLHNLAGDRPLVVGEMGIHAGDGADGERRQAEVVDWQMATVVERGVAGACLFSWTDEWWVGGAAVEGWHFGLTRHDRSPRPALEVASRWNRRTVADLDREWPAMSVVICAYNAAETLDECLRATCALDYPGLEVLLVDDGSTDATADIARRHPRARLVSIPHAGLSTARNAGLREAAGEVIAYLDSDAYPSREWPYYLALGIDSPSVGGAGGPNVPPLADPPGAHRVAHAPGGPVHVLLSDDRAEHVPGCNMAFHRTVLEEVGGFDPIYTSAGDDVDLCWRVLDRGWEIGFHPAALVWHHRRSGMRTYLRQQRGYGRSEALVQARHPDRFTPLGTARWRGRIYDSFAPALGRQRIYRGLYGAASYQSVYRGGGYAVDIAHQAGVPVATVTLATAPLGLLRGTLALPALVALVFLAGLATLDVVRLAPPRRTRGRGMAFRLGVTAMHLAQPLVRTWGRMRSSSVARRELAHAPQLPGPARKVSRGVWLAPSDRPRADITAALVAGLRRTGVGLVPATGWEDHDARLIGSTLVTADLVTSAHPVGSVQIRLRRHLRTLPSLVLAGAVVAAAMVDRSLALVLAGIGAVELLRGHRRTGPLLAGVVREVFTAPAPFALRSPSRAAIRRERRDSIPPDQSAA